METNIQAALHSHILAQVSFIFMKFRMLRKVALDQGVQTKVLHAILVLVPRFTSLLPSSPPPLLCPSLSLSLLLCYQIYLVFHSDFFFLIMPSKLINNIEITPHFSTFAFRSDKCFCFLPACWQEAVKIFLPICSKPDQNN